MTTIHDDHSRPGPDRRTGKRAAHPMPGTGGAALIAIAIVLAVIMLAGIGVLAGKWTLAQVTRDPSSEFGFPIYAGFVSEFGFVGWVITATATAFAAALRPERRQLLLTACLLSALLGLDDRFTLHEALLPRIGIPEMLVYLVYAALLLRVLWQLLPTRRRLKLPLLAIALACFAASLIIDAAVEFDPGTSLFLEDMAKFAGIVFWATFWLRYSADALRVPAAERGGIE